MVLNLGAHRRLHLSPGLGPEGFKHALPDSLNIHVGVCPDFRSRLGDKTYWNVCNFLHGFPPAAMLLTDITVSS